MKSRKFWLGASILYAVLTAPNATVIKAAVGDIDVHYWNLLRFLPVALVALPFVIKAWPVICRRHVLSRVVGAGLCMSIAVVCYVFAIELSQASYVSIVTLVTPIIIVLLSFLITKERITRRAMTGVTLAALGATVLVVLPLALAQGTISFYPLATLLALINCVGFSLAVVLMRQTNERAHVPLMASIGVAGIFTAIIGGVLFLLMGNTSHVSTAPSVLAAAIYSGVGVALIGRMTSVKILEKLGASGMGAIEYLEIFLAVLIPVVVLGERLSITMVIGGILILLGLYIIEHRKRPHHKTHFIWRHH